MKDRSVRFQLTSSSYIAGADRYRSDKIATEAQHGLIAQVLKDVIFSSRLSAPGSTTNVSDAVDTAMAIG